MNTHRASKLLQFATGKSHQDLYSQRRSAVAFARVVQVVRVGQGRSRQVRAGQGRPRQVEAQLARKAKPGNPRVREYRPLIFDECRRWRGRKYVKGSPRFRKPERDRTPERTGRAIPTEASLPSRVMQLPPKRDQEHRGLAPRDHRLREITDSARIARIARAEQRLQQRRAAERAGKHRSGNTRYHDVIQRLYFVPGLVSLKASVS